MQAWQDFLALQTFNEGALSDCAITDLSHLGIIRVSGDDKLTFLQGQLTNDINKINASHSQLSSYCSPKGRMLASFRILQRGDDILLMLPIERLDATIKRLQMFVMMSKVKLEDVSEVLLRVEISGDCASDLLPLDPHQKTNGVVFADGYSIITLAGDRPRFQIIGEYEDILSLWDEAAQTAKPSQREHWSLLDIRAGLPTVYEETTEAFVPQMANMHLIDGVSFTKGCYTGQEIVARMQYLGKLKRRMYRAKIDSDQAPMAGNDLFSASSSSGQGAGKIVDSAPSPDGGYEVLIVTQISSAESNDLRLGSEKGPALQILDLPYSYEVAKD